MSAAPWRERLYATLLRAFPRSFRDRFGAEMRAAFRARLAVERPTITDWIAIAVDLLTNGIAERAHASLDGSALTSHSPRRMDSLRQDLRFAWRTLVAGGVTTLIAVFVLAVGIGANTAIFSVVESVLLRSLPFRAPERLVGVGPTYLNRRSDTTSRYGTGSFFAYSLWRDQRDAFEDVAGYTGSQPILTGLGDPERVTVWNVTSSFFPLLGASAEMGRALVADDTLPDAEPVIVVSHAFWSARLGADPAAIGHALTLGGVPHTIVGVMPPRFHFPEDAAVWRAFAVARQTAESQREHAASRPFGGFYSVARLREGVSPGAAMARLDATTAALSSDKGWEGIGAVVIPLRRQLTGAVQRPLLLVLGAVGFVLLVACANVANIQLARTVARERELALRVAMGADRTRLLRQLLTESVLLALVGGAAGVLLAYAGVPLLVQLGGSELPRFTDIGVDGRVLAATLGISTVCGVLAGIVPAVLSIRRANPQTLKAGTAGAGTSAGRHRAGAAFVVAQLALTLVLLAGAGLLTTSFERLVHVDIGFAPERVLVAELRNTGHTGDTATLALADALLERVRAIPGVASAAVSTGTPLAEGALLFEVEAIGERAPKESGLIVYTSATRDYLATLGMRVRRGRPLRDDVADARTSIVVNEALVRAYFPGAEPIGRQLRFLGRTATIVGVVGDTKALALDEPSPPKIYQSFVAAPAAYLKIVVRATGNPATLAGPVRAAVRAVDPGLPIDKMATMREMMATSLTKQRFYTTLLSLFAAIALVMAATGLYGVVSYMVTRRTRELGVRVALGATARDVRGLVLGRSGWLAALGVAIGLVGALWATRALRGMLYDVSPGDPTVLGAVAAMLVAVALLASWGPARRAAQVDPVTSLRAE